MIACYRDAPAVPQMHERLTAVFQKIGVDYEIIFVNDASPDDAQEVLAELAARDTHVTVDHARAQLRLPERVHERHARSPRATQSCSSTATFRIRPS